MDLGNSPAIELDLDAADRPLVAALDSGPVTIWRLTTAGALDPTWGGGDGEVETAYAPQYLFQVLAEPAGGRLFLLGRTDSPEPKAEIVAVLPNGGWDPAFGAAGTVALDVWGSRSSGARFALQSDGKLVGVGRVTVQLGTSGTDFLLVRLHPNGELDPSFHGNGVRWVAFDVETGGSDVGLALAFPGGKLVAVGIARDEDLLGRWATLRTQNALIFADDFERGSSAGWAGF